MISDDQKNDLGVQVEYDNGVVLPSARGWVSCNKVHPSYSDAESFLHFLDKYTMIIVGGPKAMGAYCKINKGKSLLDLGGALVKSWFLQTSPIPSKFWAVVDIYDIKKS